MRRYLLALLLPLATLQADNKYPVQVRLYGEAKEGDASFAAKVHLLNPPKDTFINKVPIVNERDFVSFFPFPAANGSLGAYFRLDANGTHKLMQHTIAYRDVLVIAMINERIACAMLCDKKISNGLLMIASGFSPKEILQLQTTLPTMGKEDEFSDQKKKALTQLALIKKSEPKPTPKPKATPAPKP